MFSCLLSNEKRAAAGLLKRVIIQLTCFWGKLMCIQCNSINVNNTQCLPILLQHSAYPMKFMCPHKSIIGVCVQEPTLKPKVAGHFKWWGPSALLQNEVLSLGGEQWRALLKVAGISAEKTIGQAENSRPYNNL